MNLNTSTQANAAEMKYGNGSTNKTQTQSYGGGYRGVGNGNRGGRGNGRFRGRGGFKNTNNRPTCQICNKIGHTAAVCYYGSDMNYMGANAHNGSSQSQFNQPQVQFNQSQSQRGAFLAHQVPTSAQQFYPPPQNARSFISSADSIPDSSWYADSGATSHVTADPSQLTNSTTYSGYSH
ncbi:hypothetical protein Scep_011784 [Stephania cephalantha]|uniref:Uncharacterized protein n=1 Tax=Stephania cephalantha TaxID=152367 RepID=A0AAP0JFF6_9MAGN